MVGTRTSGIRMPTIGMMRGSIVLVPQRGIDWTISHSNPRTAH
jgi:hypothetical protein